MKNTYSIKDYLTKPIVTKLTDEETLIREHILESIISTHKPYSIKGDINENIIRQMSQKNVLTLNENDEIESIYPVSAFKTNKKVIFEDGRYAYAMCAIDAIGFHYTFNKPIIIEAECQHCGKKLKIEVNHGKINVLEGNNDIHVLHTDLENNDDWSCSCCCIMHFFSCEDSLEQWLKDSNVNTKIFSIDLETANKISWLLFSK